MFVLTEAIPINILAANADVPVISWVGAAVAVVVGLQQVEIWSMQRRIDKLMDREKPIRAIITSEQEDD